MTEDHTWAGDKRLIPPGGKSAPSQEERTTGTPNCEARGGVTSNENASKLCYSTIQKGKIGNAGADKTQGAINKLKSHDINNAVDNANADELQGATDEGRTKKVGNAKVQESPGAIIKKVDNSNADGMQGATDNRRKVKIGNAKVQESPGAIIKKKIDNSKASEVLGAIIKEKINNSQECVVLGAIIKMVIDNSDARVKQGVIYCQRQEEFDKDLEVSIDTATQRSRTATDNDPECVGHGINDNDLKISIDTATRRSSTATDNDLKCVGHGINDKDQEKGKRIEAESEDDNEKKTKSSGVQGAIIKDKTESVTDYGKQGAKVDHTKRKRIESIAKEGVGQSQICSGLFYNSDHNE